MTISIASESLGPASEAPAPGERPVALVVDDSPMVRSYHGAILEKAGFEVREAGNGYEGLELTLTERYDLVLADVNMPVMDGYAFVEEARQKALFAAVPIIMISTEREVSDTEEAFQRGANYYLVKPVAPEQLTLISRLLAGVAARPEGGPA